MKVLYLGHYRDCSGWGQAAMDYIRSLHAVDVDVVCRPIKLNQSQGDIPEIIEELEKKDTVGVTHVIQHVLPHHMDYNCRVHNIGLYATETSDFKYSGWPIKINQMDEAWVINRQQVGASQISGVKIPIHVVPHACDVSKFDKDWEPLDIPYNKGNFLFYFLGDFTKRKNLLALLMAFHTEFGRNEPVSLLIKTGKYGMSGPECGDKVSGLCRQVKESLKLYPQVEDYHKEVIMGGHITEENIMRLHSSCDCFVMPSYGEAWCIPAFDALGFGNTPICTDVGGMRDFLGLFKNDLLVQGHDEIVSGMTDTFPNLCTGREYWTAIDHRELRGKMRNVYRGSQHSMMPPEVPDTIEGIDYVSLKRHSLESVHNYSYEAVGKIMLERLNGN